MRTFYALVEFTDVNGVHPANQPVNLPYDTPDQIAAVQSMVAYGVLAFQSPEPLAPNNENSVQAPPVVEPGPVVLAPNDENPQPSEESSEEPQPGGDQAEANALAKEAEETPEDDPETPYFDARAEDGKFVAEDPLSEDAPAEESPVEAPKKATRRKR